MKVEITESEDQKKRLGFEIPEDVVTGELEKIYKEINSTAKIKGFRPGKVPKNIVKRFFWPQIESEIIKNLVPDYYQKAIKEADLEPIGEPKFDDFLVEEGKSISVKVTLEIKPVLEPKDYIGIEVEWQKVEATDDDVSNMLLSLQEKHSQFEVVEDRPVREGDIILFDYDGTVDDKPAAKGMNKNVMFQVGDDDFSKALFGINRGETRRVEAIIPEHFPQDALKGKQAQLDVTVKEIKEKEVPALDDEFAKDIGEYEDLESLKKALKEQIQSSLERQAENNAKNKLISTLLERNPFEPPESMVETRLNETISNFEDQLRRGGAALNTGNWDRSKVREELRPKAKRDVHLSLILEGIAEKENLAVSEEEMDEELGRYAVQARQNYEVFKEKAKDEGFWDIIESGLLSDKAMDFVVEKAVRLEVPEQAGTNPESK